MTIISLACESTATRLPNNPQWLFSQRSPSPSLHWLAALLAHADDSVRAGACRAIMDLSFPLEGKDQAVDRGAVPAVTALLEDPIGSLRAAAAGALMRYGGRKAK